MPKRIAVQVSFVLTQLVHPRRRCRRLFLPPNPRSVNEVDVPGELATTGQRQLTTVQLAETVVGIPVVGDPGVRQKRLRLLAGFGVVRLQDRHPDRKDGQIRAIDPFEHVLAHHTGAVDTAGSRRRQQDHQPDSIDVRVEQRLDRLAGSRLWRQPGGLHGEGVCPATGAIEANPVAGQIKRDDERLEDPCAETGILEGLAKEHRWVLEPVPTDGHVALQRATKNLKRPVLGPGVTDHTGFRRQRELPHLLFRQGQRAEPEWAQLDTHRPAADRNVDGRNQPLTQRVFNRVDLVGQDFLPVRCRQFTVLDGQFLQRQVQRDETIAEQVESENSRRCPFAPYRPSG